MVALASSTVSVAKPTEAAGGHSQEAQALVRTADTSEDTTSGSQPVLCTTQTLTQGSAQNHIIGETTATVEREATSSAMTERKRKRDDEAIHCLATQCAAAQQVHAQLQRLKDELKRQQRKTTTAHARIDRCQQRHALMALVTAFNHELVALCHDQERATTSSNSACMAAYRALAQQLQDCVKHLDTTDNDEEAEDATASELQRIMEEWLEKNDNDNGSSHGVSKPQPLQQQQEVAVPRPSARIPPCPIQAQQEHSEAWVPPTLLRIRELATKLFPNSAAARTRRALDDVVRVLHTDHPFTHLQADGGALNRSDDGATEWAVPPTPQVKQLAASLHTRFGFLRSEGYWILCSPRDKDSPAECWRRLQKMTQSVFMASVHLDVFVQSLKAIAMEREEGARMTHEAVNDCVRERLDLFVTTRERLGLDRHAIEAHSDDLLRETFRCFPEVLVCVEHMRTNTDLATHVFQREAVAVDVTSKQDKTMKQLADLTKDIFFAWRRARLSKADFSGMDLLGVVRLEKEMKRKLKVLIDLLYRINLGRWRARLAPGQWVGPANLMCKPRPESPELGPAATSASASSGSKPNHNSDRMFRPPQRCVLKDVVVRGKTHPGVSLPRAEVAMNDYNKLDVEQVQQRAAPVLLKHVYSWTDPEIDEYEKEMIRIYELQNELWLLKERSSMTKVLGGPEDVQMSAWQLLRAGSRARHVTERALVFGEEIALHGAAEALIKTPSLRVRPKPVPLARKHSIASSTDDGQTSEETDTVSAHSRSSSGDFEADSTTSSPVKMKKSPLFDDDSATMPLALPNKRARMSSVLIQPTNEDLAQIIRKGLFSILNDPDTNRKGVRRPIGRTALQHTSRRGRLLKLTSKAQ